MDVISRINHMVMFCIMSNRRINLVRLIVDFIIAVMGAEKMEHTSLPYDMFLTYAFVKD